jgi:ribonuclease P protein component
LTGEADLSTEQAGAQAAPRVPRPNGEQGRPARGRGAPLARTQAAERLTPRAENARFFAMERMRHRADFLAASAGAKASGSAFTLQVRRRDDEGPARVGFTVSKKVGNAVERNRVRRRLREIVRLASAGRLQAGHDYVLIGRRAALALPFARMGAELDGALDRLHRGHRLPPLRRPQSAEGRNRESAR